MCLPQVYTKVHSPELCFLNFSQQRFFFITSKGSKGEDAHTASKDVLTSTSKGEDAHTASEDVLTSISKGKDARILVGMFLITKHVYTLI